MKFHCFLATFVIQPSHFPHCIYGSEIKNRAHEILCPKLRNVVGLKIKFVGVFSDEFEGADVLLKIGNQYKAWPPYKSQESQAQPYFLTRFLSLPGLHIIVMIN